MAESTLKPFFFPRTVAIVGASRDPASIGGRLLQALVKNHFQGSVYPVNHKATDVGGLRAYPSVRDLPEAVDLAIIAVPRDAIWEVMDDCAANGVKALVVITAGFAETGAEGVALQNRLLEKVRHYGMRLIGPNCMGLLNTDPAVCLNASFSSVFPPVGRVAMASQSGALGLALLAAAQRFDLGLSSFVSFGNRADVSSNDLLEYWEQDPATDVILLYLESFGNPRRFASIARRVSRDKPIIVVKGGRTQAGQRAAGSHTAALASSDVGADALFRQTGVIRAETLEEMFDLAAALGNQPLLRGRRVGIITNAGGPAILCADECEAGGLVVPELSSELKMKLAAFLPAAASVKNPVDMIASAGPEQFRQTIQTLLDSDEVDALIVIYIPVELIANEAIIDAVREGVTVARTLSRGKGKPVLSCLMAERGIRTHVTAGEERIPSYLFPEAAARVLVKTWAYAEWRTQPVGRVPEFSDLDLSRVRDICHTAFAQRGAGWLSTEDTRQVLMALRLPVLSGGVAQTADDAVGLARQLGFPVAVKLASHRVVHKTEVGGVHLNLGDDSAVRRAYQHIQENFTRLDMLDAMEGVLVQPMVSGGVEVMAGVTEDRVFGPLVAFGLGGVYVEILGDVCFRVTPLTDHDAQEMIRSIRGYRLLEGYRGHSPADIDALTDLLLRLSRLVEEVPEISELDLNPIMALPPGQGCRIVDARIKVAMSD